MIIMDRCFSFGGMTTDVSVGTNFDTIDFLAAVTTWNRWLKQKVGISQTQVLKTCNVHMGGVSHHD
jgi:hypothetical protein